MKTTVIIPIWNSSRWLPTCLLSLRQQSYTDFNLLIVDNGSHDGGAALAQRYFPTAQIITLPHNFGFAAAVNIGIRQARGEYIALLNVDTLATPTWLAHLVARLDSSPAEVGAVASAMHLMQAPHFIDSAGDILSWYGSAYKRGHGQAAAGYQTSETVFSVCAGAALYRRSFFAEVGLFDEHYTSYLEDIDLGLRGRLYGYRYVYEPQARILHHGHSAGVVGSYYVTLMTRNRLLTILKNIPTRLLMRHFWALLYGQLYFFLVYKKPLASLKGYKLFLQGLSHVWQQRRVLNQQRIISDEALDRMLSLELGEPPLTQIIQQKLSPRKNAKKREDNP